MQHVCATMLHSLAFTHFLVVPTDTLSAAFRFHRAGHSATAIHSFQRYRLLASIELGGRIAPSSRSTGGK